MTTKTLLIAIFAIAIISCKNRPKVIPSAKDSVPSSGIFSESNEMTSSNKTTVDLKDYHAVVVKEVLPTSNYVYLNVTEDEETYWIATKKMAVNVGETYYFTGGLEKTDFESKEYNRVFDKVILVSSLISAANHGTNASTAAATEHDHANHMKQDIEMHTEKVEHRQGSMKIAELVSNPKKYEGQTVQLDGICTKINTGIMNRNWIHIKDGSKDDYDLVITSDAVVQEGATFTIKAVVALNKDFGAGYTYDLILEEGVIIK